MVNVTFLLSAISDTASSYSGLLLYGTYLAKLFHIYIHGFHTYLQQGRVEWGLLFFNRLDDLNMNPDDLNT